MTRREIVGIPLSCLAISHPSKRHADRNKVTRLAMNIKSTGQLNPLIVRRIPGEEKYEILAGAMRALALRAGEQTHADCIIIDTAVSEAAALKICRSENAQRFEINVMEDSRLVCRFMEASGLNGTETAKELGVSISEVSRCRERVYEWPLELQQLVEDEHVATSTAHAIHKIEDPAKKQEAMRLAAEGKLTRDAACSQAHQVQEASRPRESSPSDSQPSEKRQRILAKVGDGRSVTVCGSALTLDVIVNCLETLLSKARKAQRQGVEIGAFIKAMRTAQ